MASADPANKPTRPPRPPTGNGAAPGASLPRLPGAELAPDGLPRASLKDIAPAPPVPEAAAEFAALLRVGPGALGDARETCILLDGRRLACFRRPDDRALLDGPDGIAAVLSDAAGLLRAQRREEIAAQHGRPADTLLAAADLRDAQALAALTPLAQAADAIAADLARRLQAAFAVPRPTVLCAALQPLQAPQAGGSFPSAHAMRAMTVAVVLGAARSDQAGLQARLVAQASRIARNRELAGLHYPLDSQYGLALGWLLARWLLDGLGQGGAVEVPPPAMPDLQVEVFEALQLPALRRLWDAALRRPSL